MYTSSSQHSGQNSPLILPPGTSQRMSQSSSFQPSSSQHSGKVPTMNNPITLPGHVQEGMPYEDGLPQPSAEQKCIVKAVVDGKNVIVNSVAGSGKTTTLFFIAKAVESSCVILTYNKALQEDTLQRVRNIGITLPVYTIHAAAGRAYGNPGNVRDDKSLTSYANSAIVDSDVTRAQVIMIDEVQDLTPEIMTFLRKLRPKQFVLVGDPKQCIYTFRGSTADYLLEAQNYFSPRAKEWTFLHLKTSYRLTPLMCTFVESHVMGREPEQERLLFPGNSKSPNVRPEIIVQDLFNSSQKIADHIIRKIQEQGHISKVVLIVNSTKVDRSKRSPLSLLVNSLESRGIRCYLSQEDVIDKSQSYGKFLITTINAFKGRECEVVFTLSLDLGYIIHVAKDHDLNTGLPNSLYVAFTRAKSELIQYVNNRIRDNTGAIYPSTLPTWNTRTIQEDASLQGMLLPFDTTPGILVARYQENVHRTVLNSLDYRSTRDIMEMTSLLLVNNGQRNGVNCGANYITLPYTDPRERRKKRLGNSGYSCERLLVESLADKYGKVIPMVAEMKLLGTINCIDKELGDILLKYLETKANQGRKKKGVEEGRSGQEIKVGSIDDYLRSKYGDQAIKFYPLIMEGEYDNIHELYEIVRLNVATDLHNHQDPSSDEFVSAKAMHDICYIEKNLVQDRNMLILMKLICLGEIYSRPWMQEVYGDLNWIQHQIIEYGSNLLCEYIYEIEQGKVAGKFEVPLSCVVKHPFLYDVLSSDMTDNGKIAIMKMKMEPSEELQKYCQGWSTIRECPGTGLYKHEIETSRPWKLSHGTSELQGCIDYHCGNNTLLEFKIKLEDNEDDILQLATYMAMHPEIRSYGQLYNVYTGTVYAVELPPENRDKFLHLLHRNVPNWETTTSCTVVRKNGSSTPPVTPVEVQLESLQI